MKLSIITINYNNREGLRKTIESVVAQTTREFEYIVIDGGSTDGSVDVIKEFSDYIDYWVSEPDKGIYNAMNKGVKVAHGDYCQFLNSGDWLYDCNVVASFLKKENGTDIITGKTAHINGKNIFICRSVDKDISLIDLHIRGINHQSTFIKTSLCRNIPYDESYKICSDWKFFIESLIINNCTFYVIEDVVAYYDLGGISNVQTLLNDKERTQIIRSLIPDRILLDYNSLDPETFKIAQILHPYCGFRKFV